MKKTFFLCSVLSVSLFSAGMIQPVFAKEPMPPGFEESQARIQKADAMYKAQQRKFDEQIKEREAVMALLADQDMGKKKLLEEQKKKEDLEGQDKKEASPYERIETPVEDQEETGEETGTR